MDLRFAPAFRRIEESLGGCKLGGRVEGCFGQRTASSDDFRRVGSNERRGADFGERGEYLLSVTSCEKAHLILLGVIDEGCDLGQGEQRSVRAGRVECGNLGQLALCRVHDILGSKSEKG